MSRRLFSRGLSALTALAMAGCGHVAAPTALPSPVATPPSPVTPAAAANGWVSGLTDIPVALGPRREALMAIVSEQPQPDQVRVSLSAATGSAYRTLSAPPAAEAPVDPEAGFRRLDATLAGVKPRKRYRIEAVAPRQVGDAESLWVIASTQDAQVAERRISARTAYAGAHCDVLVDAADGTALDARARQMGETFDAQVWPTDTRLFGAPLPVGARGERVTIVVTPVVGNNGQDQTLGYFTARDLYAPTDAPDQTFVQHSNQGAYLYMADRVVGNGQPIDYMGTLAHEFQHLINGTHKLYGPADRQEDVWLNESLSMYAMTANGYGMAEGSRVITAHVANYLASPQRYSLTRWDLDPSQSAYGAGYLFMTYMVERVGEGALKELVASSKTGTANLDAVLKGHDTAFGRLFRDWAVATLLDGTGAGAPYEYGSLDLRGTYAGRRLNGPNLATVELPDAGQVPVLPYSASYLLLRGGSDSRFTLDVAGRSPEALGAFVLPR